MTSIVTRGIPNRRTVKRETINALFMAAFLSICIYFHYQCTSGEGRIQFGRHHIFAMGAISHAIYFEPAEILSITHARKSRLGHYCAGNPNQKACQNFRQAFHLDLFRNLRKSIF